MFLESKLFFSEGFQSVIQKMKEDNPLDPKEYVSGILWDLYFNGKNVDTKSNFIDLGDSNDKVSFIQDEKGQKLIKNIPGDRDKIITPYKGNRNQIKVGKFVRSLLRSVSNSNLHGLIKDRARAIDDQDIEKFVNHYKSTYDNIKGKMDNFKMLSGYDIVKAYNMESYDNQKGTLGSSCMRYGHCKSYLGIYEDNENIKMLTLFTPHTEEFVDEETGEIVPQRNDKIIGRALVWENVGINEGYDDVDYRKLDYNKTFMDRVYTSEDSDRELFIKYAKERGWYYKTIQNSDEGTNIFSPDGSSSYCSIVSKIKPKKYDHYPYLDTLKYYAHEDGMITNNEDIAWKPYIRLESTSGSYLCTGCDGDGIISCDTCSGSGIDYKRCDECDGDGVKVCGECEDGENTDGTTCKKCRGWDTTYCKKCNGDGRLEIDCPDCKPGDDICQVCKHAT